MEKESESIKIEKVLLEVIEPTDGDIYLSLTNIEGEFIGQHVNLIVRSSAHTYLGTPRILQKLKELKQAIKEDREEQEKEAD